MISSRGSALKAARVEGYRWSQESAREASECVRVRGYDRALHVKLLSALDSPFEHSANTGAPSVPSRWRQIYWRETERVFRREIRRKILTVMYPRGDE